MAQDTTSEAGGFPQVDWTLVAADSAGACLFPLGLLAILLGGSLLGVGLWCVCVWLDWRTLLHVRAAAAREMTPVERAALQRYVGFRLFTAGVAQALAVVLGLLLAVDGQLPVAVGIWGVAGTGIACRRALARFG